MREAFLRQYRDGYTDEKNVGVRKYTLALQVGFPYILYHALNGKINQVLRSRRE